MHGSVTGYKTHSRLSISAYRSASWLAHKENWLAQEVNKFVYEMVEIKSSSPSQTYTPHVQLKDMQIHKVCVAC